MRKLALGFASAAVVLASPALAQVYVGAEFGASKVDDTNIDVGAVDNAVQVDYDFDFPDEAGWDGALFAGYDFGGFRLEGEVSKKQADIEQVTSTIVLPNGAAPGTYAARGHTDVMSYMLNGMVDFGDDDGIQAFVGAGAGFAKVDFDDFGVFANSPAFLDDSDSGFAWQLFAGLRQAISDTVDVHVKYRYFNAGSVDLNDGVNQGDMDYSSHSLLGGISFRFGGADEAPPPPPVSRPVAATPPPPPPPAPQMKDCPGGSRVLVTQACPVPPPPQVAPTGEHG
ncbi:MAG TPA: outer membrane beta-barrel protein [Croceibacterium sp.]|nr:outer membrane beta-barrel protein [Croceibacterium sp.]